MRGQTYDSVSERVRFQTWSQMSGPVGSDVWIKVWNPVWDQVMNPVAFHAQLLNQTSSVYCSPRKQKS